MAALTFQEELLIGAFVFFNEDGTTVDTEVVAIDSQPDDVPPANWTDMQLGCVEQVKITADTKSFPRSCPRADGLGYNDDPRIVTTGWKISLTLADYSEFIHRLQLGSLEQVVDGVAFTPFKKGVEHKITGWLRIEGKAGGISKILLIDWADLRLTTIPEWKNEYGKPVLEFTILGDNNGGLSSCVVNAA